MDEWTLVGFLAGALVTIGFIPQIIKGYRTKCMDDVSYLMLAILGMGMLLWLCYGLARNDITIVAANIAGSGFAFTLIFMKQRYSKKGF